MGTSRIEIVVTGNHGCDREARVGQPLRDFCTNANCVDCRIGEAVTKLKEAGANFGPDSSVFSMPDGTPFRHGAKFTHWPYDQNGGITDDLVERKRIRNDFKTPSDQIAKPQK